MDRMMNASLFLAFIGAAMFAYGWFSAPEAMSLIQQLQMEIELQQAYQAKADRATFMQLSGCALVGIGLISFVIIRSVKIHKKPTKKG